MAKKPVRISSPAADGEDGIIESVRLQLKKPGPRVPLGIGDDTAVIIPPPKGAMLLFTTDMMVEGTHFRLEWASPWQIGWKAVAAAVSDIGAMGGKPVAAVAAVGLKGNEKTYIVNELAKGMNAVAEKYGFDIVGGDTVLSQNGIVICISVTGEALSTSIAQRKGARPGDLILVAGDTGASAAGLEVLRKKGKSGLTQAERTVVAKHLVPEPLLDAGRVAVATGCITSMMDLSDGLSADLPRLAARSGAGAIIHASQLPILTETYKVCAAHGFDPVNLAIAGGEDYGLMMTAAPDDARNLASTIRAATGCNVAVVGEILPKGNGLLFQTADDKTIPWPAAGFRHF